MAVVTEQASRIVAVPLARAWEVISDTETLNRAAGLAPMALTPLDDPSTPARFTGRTRYSGIPATFEEYPYEFERERFTEVRRRVTRGVLKDIVARVDLEAVDADHTRVTGSFSVEPRFPLMDAFARLNLQATVGAFVEAVERLALGARQGRTPVDSDALEAAGQRLARAADAPCAQALVRWVAEADDVSVQRIRPFALADHLGLPRRDMLATCVAAADAGLVLLQWQLVCPSCRTGSTTVEELADIDADEGRCHACEIAFALDMDRAVEAVFVPSPVVRTVEEVRYCGGGPARTPHVVAQANAPAGGHALLRAPARPGHYRVFVRGGSSWNVDVIPTDVPSALPPSAAPVPSRSDDDGTQGATVDMAAVVLRMPSDGGKTARVAPRGLLRVVNPTDRAAHVKLEALEQREDAATALDLATLDGFRRRYARQTLRPGLSLRVGRVAFLFSDLSDSTRLYAELGDAEAFRVVHDHFDVLSTTIAAGGGTIVKTIGDAVMAAFPDEGAAVRAGLQCLDAFERFRAADPARARTHLKLGVHVGPCYVVTANKLLDYFGQTVNVAARLQGLAAGGELVVTEAFADTARAFGGRVGAPEDVRLKGVAEDVRVVRVRLAGQDATEGASAGGARR